jgi:hypothetical protein
MPRRRSPEWTRSKLELDPARIVETIELLRRRIDERVLGSGLGGSCVTLLGIAEETRARLDWVARPIVLLRAATWLLAALVVVGVVAAAAAVLRGVPGGVDSAATLLQGIDSGIQDAVFIGVGLFFLVTAENRIKRRRALGFLRELRALAHVIDMHQLTKDPERLRTPTLDTASSPRRTLTRVELGRYLDYCSEMLSLISKVAALYAQRLPDPVVLQAVDEVEDLTSGLSSKIWQKIMILETGPAQG